MIITPHTCRYNALFLSHYQLYHVKTITYEIISPLYEKSGVNLSRTLHKIKVIISGWVLKGKKNNKA
jgi:hypothetical protein